MKQGEKKKDLKTKIRWFMQKQESSIVIATIVYVLFVTCINPTFLSAGNIFNVLRTTGFTLITVVGMSLVLITGGLDLSVGSVLALGGVITGMMCKAGVPVFFAIITGILMGGIIGGINGLIIVKAGIPPLIVTLGMQYAARGLVSVLTQGVPIYPLPEGLMKIEQTRIFNIPMVVVVAVVIAAAGHIILSKAPFGRAVYALGGNEEAARISGIDTKKTKFSVYVITSTLAALAGVFMAARLGSAEAAAGSGYELTVICGAIIGGISTFGGMGTIIGASIGALFMEILTNSLTLMRVSVYWQNLVVGVILVLAVLLDQYKRQLILKNSIKKD
ncbi:ABC transporter permease [Clostridium sp. MCC353]|uniref:ABC transporter permease n=1 Tax=Clostridium sp. MCC353 TaxID=2592646 RepID=UPI001C024371|nr:ABC transporter permease [Clostridium sp. MCC353]MBT9779752.1 ABC transporter permease [Clostridium sp. MCC353]